MHMCVHLTRHIVRLEIPMCQKYLTKFMRVVCPLDRDLRLIFCPCQTRSQPISVGGAGQLWGQRSQRRLVLRTRRHIVQSPARSPTLSRRHVSSCGVWRLIRLKKSGRILGADKETVFPLCAYSCACVNRSAEEIPYCTLGNSAS